jgi:methylated-DNA-[protein]-cysteine S-methyltransferase
VVGADGTLTGYAGGIDRKLKLLSMEGAEIVKNHEAFA